ncbi:MAG: hypothetical protein V1809_00280 [Planctomycetota bacterium]
MATIVCGANEVSNNSFDHKTIQQVIQEAGHLLNIPTENPTILVNDREVADRNYVIRPGDNVEFVKASGEKG